MFAQLSFSPALCIRLSLSLSLCLTVCQLQRQSIELLVYSWSIFVADPADIVVAVSDRVLNPANFTPTLPAFWHVSLATKLLLLFVVVKIVKVVVAKLLLGL